MIEFKLPDLAEGIDSADVTGVLVSEGDAIEPEQPVLEMETAKATFELPCPHGGKVVKIHVKRGDSVSVGQTILTIEDGAAAKPAAPAEKLRKAPAKPPEKPEAAAKRKNTPTASSAKKVEPPAEPEHPAVEVEAAEETRAKPAERPGAKLTVEPREKPAEEPTVKPAAAAKPQAPAGPATRRLARELGVDLQLVPGTGPGERITEEDVKAYVRRMMTREERAPAAARPAPAEAPAAPALPDFSQWGPIERQPLNRIARTAAENLSLAWRVAPHVTQHDVADITDFQSARRRDAQSRDQSAPKITVTALALKAAAAALKAHPRVNSSLDPSSGDLILKRYYHVGVAVDTEHGLLVPVIRDVDKKSLRQLAAEVAEAADKARNRKLTLDDFRGGTFTITNLGGIAGTAFTPIINYPEVAILGLSRAQWQQVIVDEKPQTRFLLPLSLSYDHRVVNGAEGARFLRRIATLLSDPVGLLMES
jgi:pyruvate dehydrogenase E2 component (dihydrolipoamide acetyltransferase)